jgi:hypothetical protein
MAFTALTKDPMPSVLLGMWRGRRPKNEMQSSTTTVVEATSIILSQRTARSITRIVVEQASQFLNQFISPFTMSPTSKKVFQLLISGLALLRWEAKGAVEVLARDDARGEYSLSLFRAFGLTDFLPKS